jgi:hypothetical protein
MTNTNPKRLGINLKEQSTTKEGVKKVIRVGIHLETFLQTFKDKVNDQGWIDFGILELLETNEKGYNYKPVSF